MPLSLQPKLKLKRLNDTYLDNFINKIETQKIWHSEVVILFEALFNTVVDPIGFGDERTYSFSLNSKKYNKDLNYLKNKIIEHLDINN